LFFTGPFEMHGVPQGKNVPQRPRGPFFVHFFSLKRWDLSHGADVRHTDFEAPVKLNSYIDAHRFTQTLLQAIYNSTMRIKKNIPIFHILLMRIAAKYLPYLFAPPTAHTTRQTTPQPLQYTCISLQTLHSSRCSKCIRIN